MREGALLVQRATNFDGSIKRTKGRKSRTVRLLAPLEADLREWRMAAGRPAGGQLLFPRSDGDAWTKEDWATGARTPGVPPVAEPASTRSPRPYDLRHSFASLLLAEGRTIHSVTVKEMGRKASSA